MPIRFVDKLAAHGQTERGSIPVGPRCCAAQIPRRRSSAALPELPSNRISTERTMKDIKKVCDQVRRSSAVQEFHNVAVKQ